MGAEDLGKRLLAEVEEVGLDEILNTLRLTDPSTPSHFSLPALDALVQTATDLRATATKTQPTPPIIELLSPAPGSGKTHLLYHLAALAVLPTTHGGRQSSAIILDADGKFSIPRLVQQMTLLCKAHHPQDLKDVISTSLKHIHTFHPQALPSLLATITSLPTYFFNANRHYSFDRAVGFIALDSAAAFYWQAKCDAEEASLLNQHSREPNGYVQLAGALKNAGRVLNAPVIFSSWNMNSVKNPSLGTEVRAYRSSLPPPWQALPALRLVVRRIPVRKLPVEIGVEEALREGEMRQRVVEQGRFEVFVNEWGVDERATGRSGGGFEFWIREDGVHFEEGKEGSE